MTLPDKFVGLPTLLRPFAFYSILALAFFIPVHVRMSINMLIAVITLSLITGNWHGLWERLRRNWPLLLMWAFWLMHVIGITYAPDKQKVVDEIVQKISFVALPLTFTLIEIDESKQRRICSAFLLGCLCSMLFMLGRSALAAASAAPESPVLSYFIYCDLTRPFHPATFAMFIALPLAIALYRMLDERQRTKWRIAYAMYVILVLLFGYLITSRSGIFVMLVVLVFIALVRFKYGRVSLLIMGGVGLIVGLVALMEVFRTGSTDSPAAGFLHYSKLRGYGTDTQQDARLFVWSCVPQAVEGHWLLGYGPNCMQPALNEVFAQRGYPEARFHAHNQYMDTLLGCGILGLVLLLAIMAYPFVVYIGQMHKYAVPLAFIIIAALHAMFDRTVSSISDILFFALFYSLFFCLKPPSNIS